MKMRKKLTRQDAKAAKERKEVEEVSVTRLVRQFRDDPKATG